jgi:hypothetical protein
MKVSIYIKFAGDISVALMLVVAAISVFMMAVPVSAHAPQGAGEVAEVEIEPIQICDQERTLLEISIDDVAEIHGELCMCVAGGFRVTQAAIVMLYGEDEIPVQGELSLVYHHPGKGQKQVFEHILTPECVIYEKMGNPQHMTMEHWVYTFTRLDTGEVFETQVNEGVITPDFFDLRYTVSGFEKGWHENQPTEEEQARFAAAYTESLNNSLTLPLWELYSGVEEPEEPLPTAAIAFTGVLIVAVTVGLVYSARGRRRSR